MLYRKVFVFLSSVILLLNAFTAVHGQCPPADDILPCKCTTGPNAALECMGIHNYDILKNVFYKSINYKYEKVYIFYSTFQYLPHELFAHTQVKELYLENSTLVSLFDSPPNELQNLHKIYLENTKIYRLSNWNLFQPLTSLRILTIYYNQLQKLDSSLDKFVTRDLEQLSLYSTGTEKIEPGALTEFVNLNKLAIDACKLTKLSRNLFPRPFNVKVLYFNDNEIDFIPDDLFVDMPNLQTVGMKKNYLTTIPEPAFEGNSARITYIMLDGNPLKCDCELLWLVKAKPESLSGTCATPIRLHDRQLKELEPKDFKC